MLSFTYISSYGNLNIFKVTGQTILNYRDTFFNNYILTDKDINEVKVMTADEITTHILSVTLKNLIIKTSRI